MNFSQANRSRSSQSIFRKQSDEPHHTSKSFLKLNRMPSDHDYSKILKKLDLVILNATYHKKLLTLTHENPLNIFLEKGLTQYIHINTLNFPTPLHVKYLKIYGKIRSYISKSIAEPSEEIYDEKTSEDLIEVKELSANFRIPRVAIGIKALTDSNFIVSIKYGSSLIKNKIPQTERYYRRFRHLITKEEDSLDEKIKLEKTKAKIEYKKRNSTRNGYFKGRSSADLSKIKLRRELTYTRSKINFENLVNHKKKIIKKDPSVVYLRKKKIFTQNQLKISEIIMALFFVIQVSASLKNRLKKHQKDKINDKKILQKIINFQQIYRSWTKNLSDRIIFERARINLLFYRHNSLGIFKRDIKKKIKKVFNTICLYGNLWRCSDEFHHKGNFYTVLLIQREWRKYQILRFFRLKKIEKAHHRMLKKMRPRATENRRHEQKLYSIKDRKLNIKLTEK